MTPTSAVRGNFNKEGKMFETKEAEAAAWAKHLVEDRDVVADGHLLLTLGPHTGHTWKTVAMCETAAIAAAIAAALARAKKP